MKVIAYGIQPSEKGILALANHKKHDITLISNPLSAETAFYAQGKEAIIVFAVTEVAPSVMAFLAGFGIRYLLHLSGDDPSQNQATALHGFQWVNISYSRILTNVSAATAMQRAAEQTILFLDQWESEK